MLILKSEHHNPQKNCNFVLKQMKIVGNFQVLYPGNKVDKIYLNHNLIPLTSKFFSNQRRFNQSPIIFDQRNSQITIHGCDTDIIVPLIALQQRNNTLRISGQFNASINNQTTGFVLNNEEFIPEIHRIENLFYKNYCVYYNHAIGEITLTNPVTIVSNFLLK